MLAVTLDAGIAGEHVADPLQRFFGVALLDMTDQGVNHRHAEDHQVSTQCPMMAVSAAAASST